MLSPNFVQLSIFLAIVGGTFARPQHSFASDDSQEISNSEPVAFAAANPVPLIGKISGDGPKLPLKSEAPEQGPPGPAGSGLVPDGEHGPEGGPPGSNGPSGTHDESGPKGTRPNGAPQPDGAIKGQGPDKPPSGKEPQAEGLPHGPESRGPGPVLPEVKGPGLAKPVGPPPPGPEMEKPSGKEATSVNATEPGQPRVPAGPPGGGALKPKKPVDTPPSTDDKKDNKGGRNNSTTGKTEQRSFAPKAIELTSSALTTGLLGVLAGIASIIA